MQLNRHALFALALLAMTQFTAPALAQGGEVNTTVTVFREQGGPLEMTVITPSAAVGGTVGEHVSLSAGYEADIVSGASVAVVDAPSGGVDAISSATRLNDVRHTAHAAFGLLDRNTRFTANYAYGRESDYQSHSFSLSAQAELFERNTRFELSWARGFDRVCNLAQPRAQEAVDRQRLPSSDGCFGGADRETLKLRLQTFQGSWSQAWTPVFTTQLTLTAQILNGYQGNPYRAVWLGRSAAQEYHPNNRARIAGGLRMRIWLKPLSGALQIGGRFYRDTWNVQSITASLGYEQSIASRLRLRVRGRYYTQTAAAFYSDDYVLNPRGQYFTGDRELSAMDSITAGLRLLWSIPENDEGRVAFLGTLNLVAKFDFIFYRFDDFHYGAAPVPNNQAIVATLSLEGTF